MRFLDVQAGSRASGCRGSRSQYVAIPNAESMAAIALALGAGGALKSARTTVLMSGAEGLAAMQKAATVAKSYTPAR